MPDPRDEPRASSASDVRGLYDSWSAAYAEMMDAEIDLPVYADVLGRLAERIAGAPGPVVDTSCGPGHMLARYHERYDPKRPLIGIDLSPSMADAARTRLGAHAEIYVGDMRAIDAIESGSAAAALSFFALHHLDPAEVLPAFREWARVLAPSGQLVVAAWEGAGTIDYGDEADVVAFRFTKNELEAWAGEAGFVVSRCVVDAVEEMPMDAVYLEASKS